MKFTDLYNRVFVAEQETEVANPDTMDDVEGAPVPAPTPAPVDASGGASPVNLTDYVVQIRKLIDSLNQNKSGESLQTIVNRLDVPETPYAGFKSASGVIEAAVRALGDLEAKLLTFINSASTSRK